MNRAKQLQGPCEHCGGTIRYPAHLVGTQTQCPHCGTYTELTLERPPEEPAVPRRTVVWTLVAVTVLLVGLAGVMIALKRTQQWAAREKAQLRETAVPAPHDFTLSEVVIEKAPNTALTYAVGTVRNPLDRDRHNLVVELELTDRNGKAVGSSRDSRALLKAGEQWRFKAPVLAPNATSARIVSLKEAP